MRPRTDLFALRVVKPEDVPVQLRPIYLEALQAAVCRQAIYAPPLTMIPSRHLQPISGYLVMNFDDYLMVAIDRAEQSVERVCLPLKDLICVELGQVLLFSWIKLVFGSDETQQIKILFNTVRADLFVVMLNLIRSAVDLPLSEHDDLVTAVAELDFKFNNVLHDWLRPKEVLLGSAFQPEVRARRFLVFERQIMPPLLAALTNRQFLLITEEPPVAREQIGKFTEVYNYCPLSKIESVTVETCEEEAGIAELHLALTNGNARFFVRSKVSTDLAPQFASLCKLVNDLITKNRFSNARVLANA